MLSMSLLTCARSVKLVCSSTLTVVSSSLVDCNSSFTDCISSLKDSSSSLEVSSFSLVVWRYSSLARSSCWSAVMRASAWPPPPPPDMQSGGLLRLCGVDGRLFLQDDQVQSILKRRGRVCRHPTDGQVDRGEVVAGLDPQAPAEHDPLLPRGFVQSRDQLAPQSFAGHLQDVADFSLARSRFQVLAGSCLLYTSP